jgi:CRP/FNR family cyclic AMP-dependent transcriptional regulator
MNTQAKVEAFFAKYPMVGFEKGEVLIQADTDPSGIFYLVTGQVREYDVSPAGDQIVVNVFQPPAFFPMSWAINKTPNKYIFEAFTEVAARKAPASAVLEFLHDEPDVVLDLLARVYRGTDGLQRRMVYVMENDAQKRLLMELLISGERFGEPRADGAVFIALHEGELASRVGLARETANRSLRELKKEGLVRMSRSGIELASLQAIQDRLRALD